jgi:hypothetical protein
MVGTARKAIDSLMRLNIGADFTMSDLSPQQSYFVAVLTVRSPLSGFWPSLDFQLHSLYQIQL